MPLVTALAPLPPEVGIDPAESLFLDIARLRAQAVSARGIAGAVTFADGVSAGGERYGFFIIHRHAFAKVSRTSWPGRLRSGRDCPFTPSGFT